MQAKAFDNIQQVCLVNTLRRSEIIANLLNVIMYIYEKCHLEHVILSASSKEYLLCSIY
jgi:hypothetical protein